MAVEKAEFQNTLDGVIGVVTIGPSGKEQAVPVGPGERVWLSEDEQILTANSHKDPADNPFINRTVTVVDGDTTTEHTLEPILKLITEPRPLASARPIGKEAPRTTAQGVTSAEAPSPIDPGADAPDEGEPDEGDEIDPGAGGQVQGGPGIPVPEIPRDASPADAADLEVTAGAEPAGPEGGNSGLESEDVIGAAVEPSGDAPQGSYGPTEEVATPMAPAKTKGG